MANDDFLIVGLGASAGGVKAFQSFFEHLPRNSGMAFVVILHLSPDHESQLAEVLQASARIPVQRVHDRVRVEPDRVYVVSPRQSLAMSDGHLVQVEATSIEERRAPIDIFFRTLGETQRQRAVCIVLSGTGADGSMGLKRVKERGGICLVQDPDEADHTDMPRNAIATGLVDDVLPVSKMPGRIVAYRDQRSALQLRDEPQSPADPDERALQDIFAQLRQRTGHDFSNYKRATVLRRIERRLGVRQLSELISYAKFLREYPDEAQALLKDLLISVTNFFRDPAAFAVLERDVIPRLFEGKSEEQQVRIWVAGCATGEEAYSLGMLVAEQGVGTPGTPGVQIFATDIDEQALAVGREGFYTLNDAADVSSERLRRFFTKEPHGYRVRKDLREMVLFANHNIIRDPPFSHLDLVSCRNLLIYLNGPAQQRVLDVAHFALNPGAYLFLGGSETVERVGDAFVAVSKEAHVFQSRGAIAKLPIPGPSLGVTDRRPRPMPFSESRGRERFASPDLHLRLVEQYAPPSIVVNDEHDIVHLSDNAAMYLQFAGGEPSNNLLKFVRPELRLELRTALFQAAQRRTNVNARQIAVSIEGRTVTVNLLIRPVLRDDDPARGFFLVLFEQTEADEKATDHPAPELASDPAGQLEDEVVRLKSQLRATVERYETQAEELKASNEESQAINEELRSASEELETSREELQSLNEELRTVNQELKVKVDEQTQTSNDLTNLINSTDIGTIFLDRTGRIKLFTPRTRDLFNLIPSDRGRPLADISHHLADTNLQADVERVLDRLDRLEREVETPDGRWFLLRIGPYRTADDRIDGVVLAFVDVTERKRATERVRVSEERLRRSFEIETVGILFFQPDRWITHTNDAFLQMSGYAREDITSRRLHWETLAVPGRSADLAEGLRQFATLGRLLPREVEHARPDGTRWWGLYAATRLDDQEGVAFVVDVTERRRAEASLRDADRRKNEFLATLAHELRNPLAPIRTAVQILRLKNVPEALVHKSQDTIDRQVGHMVRLVDDLLELSRITHGKIELRRQHVAVSDILETAAESARPMIDEAGNSLTVSLPGEALFVHADPMRLAQVFSNLLHNAVKYSPEGGQITVAAGLVGRDIRIAVTDSGVGIPEEAIPHVFDMFTQGNDLPMGREQTGLGIGLTLVRTLVEAHGGRVEARSDGAGKGSEFAVYLPAAADDAVDPPSPETIVSEDLGGKRVVVVDDNQDAASTLVNLLSLLGADAAVAFDGAQGLTTVAAHRPDIVFLDLGMPGMNGFELARRIRSGPLGDDVTLVAVTGRSQPQDREAALEAGFDGYLIKPATTDQILAACRASRTHRTD